MRSLVRKVTLAALAFGAVARAGAQALPEPKVLMDKHNAAIGGRAAIDKHTSVHFTATMSLDGMGGAVASMDLYRSKPNKLVQKINIPQLGDVLQGYDGTVAWTTNPMAGAQLIQGDAASSVKNNADFFANLQDPSNYSSARTVGIADWEGRKCYKVQLVRDGREGFEYFDAETGLLAGISGSTPTPQGNIEVTTVLAEYAEWGGLRLPKKIVQKGGQGGATITFTSAEFDNVDAAMFDLPPAVKALVKP